MRYDRRTVLGVAFFVAMSSCTGPRTDHSATQPNHAPTSQYGDPNATPEYAKQRPAAISMDPCLVGTWKTESIIQLDGGYITRGGGGATVTFRADGLQLVDYTGMEPMMGGNEKPIRLIWEGQASAIISAAEGKARVVEGRDTDLTTETITFHGSTEGKRVIKQRGDEYADFLGPAGLGAVKPQNQYTCTGNSLTYESNTDASASRMNDGSSTAGYTVRLRRQ